LKVYFTILLTDVSINSDISISSTFWPQSEEMQNDCIFCGLMRLDEFSR